MKIVSWTMNKLKEGRLTDEFRRGLHTINGAHIDFPSSEGIE